jgi:hypothetical protein
MNVLAYAVLAVNHPNSRAVCAALARSLTGIAVTMRHNLPACLVAMLIGLGGAGSGWAGTEGANSTFYGAGAGTSNTNDLNANTFVGASAGTANTSGYENTFLGQGAGYLNATGNDNTFVGRYAGINSTNSFDTFIGAYAGWFNTSGTHNTFVGHMAGKATNIGGENTFLGEQTGPNNTSGFMNTFVGRAAGTTNTTGIRNTYVGASAGESNDVGDSNVFLGNAAGHAETGSYKLYIDDCVDGLPCTSPLIYGEFDNHLLKLNGVLNVRANGVAKSQMHFSKDDTNTGGWITSVLDNNFFLSSGTSFDATAGNWTQRSPDNSAVIAGSGSLGYRIFTNSGNTVGATFTPTVRLHIDYSGQFGINTPPVAGHEIHTLTGAYEMAGSWVDASSRELKDNIVSLTNEDAAKALAGLNPVRYNYKVTPDEGHVGFIAEDVPELVARKDRKGLSPMDIVAVLTKVVQEQKLALGEQARSIQELRAAVAALQAARSEK